MRIQPMLLLLVFMFLGGSALQAGPVEDRIDRHVEWLGGEEALRSQPTLRMTGDIKVAGLEGTVIVTADPAGYQHLEYDLKIIRGIEVITPDDAWELNASGQVETMGTDKATVQRRAIKQGFYAHLLGEDDATRSLLDPEERDGKTWEVIRFAYPGGDHVDLFLDPETGSNTWTRRFEDTETVWTRFDDWQVVDGVRYSFLQESIHDLPMKNQTVTWSQIAAVGSDPGLFVRPAAGKNPVTIHEASGSTPWMPMTLFADRYIFLQGTVNGVGTEIVLDSGAGMTVLDRATTEILGLKGEGALPAVGTGGAVKASIVNEITIQVGSLEIAGLAAAVIDLSDVNQRMGRDLPVILGKEVFNSVIVDIDYPNRRIAFRDPARWSYQGPGNTVPLIPAEDSQKQIEMQVEDLAPAVFDLDTGNGGEFVLFGNYAKENKILEDRPMISERSGGGVGGATVSKITTLRSVTFAGYVLKDVPVVVSQVEQGSFNTNRFAGNVGAGVFCRFRMIFDYPHDRLIVEPGPGWDTEPFRKNRTGIQFGQTDNELLVRFVAPGSPAEQAGVKQGDRIVLVNGKTIGEDFWDKDFLLLYGDEGKTVNLEMKDGRKITITAATYY